MQVPTVRAAADAALSERGARTSSGGMQAPGVRATAMGLQEPTIRHTSAGIAPSARGRTTAGGMQASPRTTAGGMQAPSRRPSQLETQRPAQPPISVRGPNSLRPEGRTTAHGTGRTTAHGAGSRRPSQLDTQRQIETQRPRFAPVARPISTPPNARVYGAMALGWLVLVGVLVQRQWFSAKADDVPHGAAPPRTAPDPSAGPTATPRPAQPRADQATDPGEPPRAHRAPQILYRGKPGEVPAICSVPWLDMYGRAARAASDPNAQNPASPAQSTPAQAPLIAAASSGSLDDVQSLLDQGAEVDARDALNRTALMAASQAGRSAHVQALLVAGADARARGLWDASGGSLSALDLALQAGKLDTARLIEADVLRTFTTLDASDLSALDEAGETPLHWVARYADARSAQLLLERGAEREARSCPARPGDERGPHQADPHAATPLLLAIWGDNPAVARQLLESQADARAVDERGRGVFHLMRHQEMLALTPLLLEAGADPLQPDRDGKSALDVLAEQGLRAELLRALAAAGHPLSNPTATLPDLFGVIQRLASARDDRNAAEDPAPVVALLESDSELVRATDARGRSALFEASAQGLAAVAEALVSRGARVDSRDREGRTPLHLARDADTVKLLLRLGADANARDAGGDTPLHLRAATQGSLDAVTALIQAGANPRLADHRRKSALDLARASGSPDVVAYLEQL